MIILILEDRGSVSYFFKELFEGVEGHIIYEAFSVLDAQSYWHPPERSDGPEVHGRPECIIADLNLNPQGLAKHEREETRGGLLTGWIWLRNYVFSEQPEMRKRTIIYSEYVEDLRAVVGADALHDVRIMGKRGPESPLRQLREAVREIAAEVLKDLEP